MTATYSIAHHGAVNGVTGSCHELRFGPDDAPVFGVLIDCGLFQGAEVSGTGAHRDSPRIEFPIDHIGAVVITHVHIDHCGRLPYLLAAGYKGPIYCSRPSALLLPLVIEDAIKIGVGRKTDIIEAALKRLEQQLRPIEYGQWQTIPTEDDIDLNIRLQPAGHILGSAYVECRLKDDYRVVFSGDLGASNTPLLPEPTPPDKCDELVIESTYGDRQHENRETRAARLQAIVERAMRDRGAVLIPAFSIGRTQELLYEIEDIINRCKIDEKSCALAWDELEIVVDSPLASKFTRVYRKAARFWDAEARARLADNRHPLAFDQLRTVNSHQDHLKIVKHIRDSGYPAIVIAASGMCAGGRITNYLKALIEDPRTDILFVGYQAAGTPGRDIQRYGPQRGYVILDHERFTINAKVHTIGGYSAHADQSDLIAFCKNIKQGPGKIRIVHGDEAAKLEFKRLLNKSSFENVYIPH